MNSKVKILILNWNGRDILLDCLESVSKINYDNFEIIVIDNASSDDSIKQIHFNYPEVKVIALNKNYGYSGGYNKAFELLGYPKDEFYMLLNNDTIVDKDILNNFLVTYDSLDSKKYILGAKIYYMDNKKTIWYSGGKVNLKRGVIKHIGISEDNNLSGSYMNTGYITGCCLFTHNSNFKRLNGFDQSFTMYCEDVDLSIRASKLGIQCIYVPSAILWHKVSHSLGGVFNYKKILFKLSSLLKLYNKHVRWYFRYFSFFLLLLRMFISGLKLFFIRFNNRFN